MNAADGTWHLRRVIIRYSETGGSSLGARFYLRHLLPVWRQRNPQVVVVTEHSKLDHPQLLAEWSSGERFEISLRKMRPRQIEDLLNLQRNSESPNLYLRHGGPRVWTERRSVQGLWQPSPEAMFKALKFAREASWLGQKHQDLKYSSQTLKLCQQHLLEKRGRWGDQSQHPKGFDRHVLEDVLNRPFISDSVDVE
ncbi:MRPL51 [Symbiodinium natans]|uniref:Large ribosomal subunit protein mL43 n=1 Tax=Symbiodinium natans TaxID=878477 RepID=A0A812Q0F9_9DINO|nr:MRPL51 [Symbiodinium natans]